MLAINYLTHTTSSNKSGGRKVMKQNNQYKEYAYNKAVIKKPKPKNDITKESSSTASKEWTTFTYIRQ
jgi:hypothetical protein